MTTLEKRIPWLSEIKPLAHGYIAIRRPYLARKVPDGHSTLASGRHSGRNIGLQREIAPGLFPRGSMVRDLFLMLEITRVERTTLQQPQGDFG